MNKQELKEMIQYKKLTPNFMLSEFLIGDSDPEGYMEEVEDRFTYLILSNLQNVAENLQVIRRVLGNRPIRITSGYRPTRYNQKVGGSLKSKHLSGEAADFVVEGLPPAKVQDILKNWYGGLGKNESFTHIDLRDSKVHFSY